MQRISELDRAGKVDLFKRIQAGEIDPSQLTPDTILVTDPDEAFLGLMVAGSSDPEDPADVLIAGDAEKNLSRFLEDVQKGEREAGEIPGGNSVASPLFANNKISKHGTETRNDQ